MSESAVSHATHRTASVGGPPRARVLRSKGETLYTLNWLPIGGFVKLEGEDGDLEQDPRSFSAQSLTIRLVILAAGVLMNLVTNALNVSRAGMGVTVAARREGGDLRVEVVDQGPGVPDGEKERIFEEFHQADSSSTRKKGGTGLGLAIAKRIIELHGGRLWVESTPGQGATFRFTVPVRVVRPREAANSTPRI